MYNLIKGMALLLAIATLLPSLKAHAIYQIYTCNIVKTRVDGGAWVEKTECYHSGWGGLGDRTISQDREQPHYELGTVTYIDDGVEITQEEATKSTIEACLEQSFADMQDCKR